MPKRESTIPYYPILEAEISKSGIKKQDIAKKLNITPRSLSCKMTGQIDFWWKEVQVIQSMFPNVPKELLLEHRERV